MKKFELTSESIVKLGKTLYRIRALMAFGDVEEGELGGFLEKEENLSQDGDAWVCGNAIVSGDAWVFKTSHYLVIGPMGSRNGFTTFFRTKNLFIGVSCGCFRGNVDEFVKKVKETHGDNKHAKTYLTAAELAKMQIDLTPEEDDPEE